MELNEIYGLGINTHKIHDKSIEDYDFEEELASTEMLNTLEDLYSMEVMEKIHQKNTSDLLKMCNRISNDFANKINNESVSKSIESYCQKYSMEAENDQQNNTQQNTQNNNTNNNTNDQPNQNSNNPNNQQNDNKKQEFMKKMVEILKKLGNAIVNFVQTIFKKIQDFLFDHFNKTPPKDVSTDAIRKVLPKDEKLLFIIKNSGNFGSIGKEEEGVVAKFIDFVTQNKEHPEKIKDSDLYKQFIGIANKLYESLDEKISDEKVIQILDKFTGNKLGTIKESGVIEFASKADNLTNASETIKKAKELVNSTQNINRKMSVIINVGGIIKPELKETLNYFKEILKFVQNDLRCINEYIKAFRNSYRLNVEAQKAMNDNSNNQPNQNNNTEQTPIENK